MQVEQMIENEKRRFVEDIQETVVYAGGNFLRQQYVLDLTVRQLVEVFYTYGIIFNVTFSPEIPNQLKGKNESIG